MIIGDITNTKHLNKALKTLILYFILLVQQTWKKQIKTFTTIENNILSVVNILKSALKNKVKKLFLLVQFTPEANKVVYIARQNYLLK